MMIFALPSQGSSSRASGTRVVLPAPGEAWSTAALDARRAARSSPKTASIGSGSESGRVILRDAARDQFLKQLGLPLGVLQRAQIRQRVPQVLHDDEQL